ncbi:unnamed protein product [Mytilus coruscus]|uniref:Uncharacterized protein n=1 Tax=Mytilus coruscus TaxID=42192 RepID=A0A6J8DNV0_MYTCO|nr:unnamed protein product [Mytilus coruscus]
MRSMHNEIQQTCFKNGINIECSNFDGQWLRLATRDEHDKPLTLLQLQRDTWEEAKKANRDQILTIFSKALLAPAIENDLLLHKTTGSLSVSCPLYKKLIDALEKKKGNQADKLTYDSDAVDSPGTDQLACLPDEALDLLIGDDNADMITALTHEDQTHPNEQTPEETIANPTEDEVMVQRTN